MKNFCRLFRAERGRCKIGFLFVLMVTLIAFLIPDTGWANPSEILKVGVITTLTGGGASYGLPRLKAAQMLAEEINKQGGLKIGGKTYTIQTIEYDDKWMPDASRAAAERLVYKDKVKFIVGAFGATACFAAQEVTEPNKILATYGGWDNKVLGPNKPYSFRPNPVGTNFNAGLVSYLVDTLKVRRLALVFPDEAGGHGVSRSQKTLGQSFGMEIVFEKFFPPDEKDHSAILTAMIAAKPDLAYFGTTAGHVGLLIKQSRELGYKGHIYYGSVIDTKTLIEIAGVKSVEGFHVPAYPTTGPLATDRLKSFRKRYEARWGGWDDPAAEHSQWFSVIIEGIKAAGSVDPTKVKQTLESMDYITTETLGRCKWGGKEEFGIRHQLLCPVPIAKVHNGQIECLALISAEENEKAYMKVLKFQGIIK